MDIIVLQSYFSVGVVRQLLALLRLISFVAPFAVAAAAVVQVALDMLAAAAAVVDCRLLAHFVACGFDCHFADSLGIRYFAYDYFLCL